MSGVMVFSEDISSYPGLLGAGDDLAGKLSMEVTAVVVGEPDYAESLLKYGVKRVVSINTGETRLHPESYADILEKIVRKHDPDVLLISATNKGKEIAPRLSVRLKTGCITECTGFDVSESKEITFKRIIFGGIATGSFEIRSKPAICTVKHELFDAPEEVGSAGEVLTEEIDYAVPEKSLVEEREIEKTVDLQSAERIVSAGRGFTKKEDLDMVFELASLLNAEVGCSRPIAEDFKWLPKERQVGLTGEIVNPELYIAIGISGQIQHIVGMKDSRIVVAINKSKDAPIFQHADYGIVGDLYRVVPELIKRLKEG